jgi:hypothetical protein
MTIKRRTVRLTTGTDGATGTASKTLGLGASYGRVFAFEFKGDDANVDNNNTLAITDADGRIILKATALDAGTDDSTLKKTSQIFSTVGVRGGLVEDEDSVYQGSAGAKTTDNVGAGEGIVARSPLTVAIASGTDGDVQEVSVFVEV